MILKRGDAAANKISFGDCEAKRNRAELNQTELDSSARVEIYNLCPPVKAHSSTPAFRPNLR